MCLLLEFSHSLHSLLNGRHAIYSMTVIQINRRHSQPLQTPFTRLLRIFWIAPHTPLPILIDVSKFRSQENVISLPCALEPFADEVLVVCIHVRTVPIGFAQFVCFV